MGSHGRGRRPRLPTPRRGRCRRRGGPGGAALALRMNGLRGHKPSETAVHARVNTGQTDAARAQPAHRSVEVSAAVVRVCRVPVRQCAFVSCLLTMRKRCQCGGSARRCPVQLLVIKSGTLAHLATQRRRVRAARVRVRGRKRPSAARRWPVIALGGLRTQRLSVAIAQGRDARVRKRARAWRP